MNAQAWTKRRNAEIGGHRCDRCAWQEDSRGTQGTADLGQILGFCSWLRTAGERIAGHQWARGRWVTADPGGHLGAWLDTCPEGYWRVSSHLTRADRRSFAPRGIDLPSDGLPGTRLVTLLYQPFQWFGQRRLLLKLETAGARLLPARSGICPGPSHRVLPIRDLAQAPHHVLSGLWRKGPQVVGRRGESFGDLCPQARLATELLAERVGLPAEAEHRLEVHALARHADAAVAQRRLPPALVLSWVHCLPLRKDLPMEDLRLRMANEVVLLAQDFATADLPQPLISRLRAA